MAGRTAPVQLLSREPEVNRGLVQVTHQLVGDGRYGWLHDGSGVLPERH
jgi:hypothetical protein